MAESRDKAAVTVRIGGEDHVIRTNAEPEYTLRCAKWVDDRIAEIQDQLGLIEGQKAAILAALSITDELFRSRNQLEEDQEGMTGRAEALAQKMEVALAEEAPELELALDGETQK